MNLLLNLTLVVQIVSALALIVLILLQHGKGADMGAAFGSGASGSLFGASGSANFLSHTTAVLATIFLATTLALAHFGYSVPTESTGGSVLDRFPVTAPATPAPAPAAPGAAEIPAAAGGEAGSAEGAGTAAVESSSGAPATPATGADQIPTK